MAKEKGKGVPVPTKKTTDKTDKTDKQAVVAKKRAERPLAQDQDQNQDQDQDQNQFDQDEAATSSIASKLQTLIAEINSLYLKISSSSRMICLRSITFLE